MWYWLIVPAVVLALVWLGNALDAAVQTCSRCGHRTLIPASESGGVIYCAECRVAQPH